MRLMYMLEERMVRTQIYLTKEERDALINHFSRGRREAVLHNAAGVGTDRADLPDFAGLRTGWDRR